MNMSQLKVSDSHRSKYRNSSSDSIIDKYSNISDH